MDSYSFNALPTIEKIEYLFENHLSTFRFDQDTHEVIQLLAAIIETVKLNDHDDERFDLVQFLNDHDRGRGCQWCGG